jgi:hypothetical protein
MYVYKDKFFWLYFYLPFDKPFSKKVILDIGDCLLTFTKNDEIIRFYTKQDDSSVFTLSYDFEESKWMMWLHDEDKSWVPEDGCEWRFICNNIANTKTIVDQAGTLEWKSE